MVLLMHVNLSVVMKDPKEQLCFVVKYDLECVFNNSLEEENHDSSFKPYV